MLLQNQVAIVTGTGPNIGGQIARTLAENGAKVVCFDLQIERAKAAMQQIIQHGGSAIALAVDITNPTDVHRAVNTAIETFGGVHILVNNAAITHREGLSEVTLEPVEPDPGRYSQGHLPLQSIRGGEDDCPG